MPTFGSHPTEKRLHLSGVGALYTLASDHSRALKVLDPADGLWTDSGLRHEIDAFLLRYKTQRVLAKDSKHWASVHEISAIKGAVDDDKPYPGAYRASGAYAILDNHERSLATLFESHVHVTNDDLRNLFTGIITGLLDAKRITKRPHGALKLSNVLLAHSEPLASATVRLTDPLPDGFLPAKPFEKDLHDLGKLIYSLVLLRPFDGGTIAPSREWKALGPNGEDWRKLAVALLEAGEKSSPEDRDLEQILPKIATWTLQPKKAPVIPLAIAASILLIGSVFGLYFLLRTPTADYSQPNWARLCLAYDSWFGDFVDAATDPAAEKKFTTDPNYPAQVIALLNAAGPKLASYKPTSLAKSAHSLSDLAVHPTDDAKSGVNAYKTNEALKLVDAVQAALAPGQWPMLTSLDATSKTYKERNWNKPANAINDLIAGAKPPVFTTLPLENADPPKVQSVNEIARIDSTVAAAKSVTDIEKRWAAIQAGIKTLPATHVPLLEKIDDFAITTARSPDEPGSLNDVTALAASFSKIETLINQLSTELNRKDQTIVYDELAKDPAAQIPNNDVAALTVNNYLALPTLAKAYVQLPEDPTAKTPYTQQLDKVQTEIITVIQTANKDDKNLPKILTDHSALRDQVTRMASIAKITKNKDLLDTEVKKADTLLASLLSEGDEAVTPYTVKPADFLAQQQAYETTSPIANATPVVRDQWKQHHQEYLATIRTASQGLDHFKYADYVHYKANLVALESNYAAFDTLIPAKVPGLVDIAATGTDWQKTIAAHVAADYRATALTDVMTNPALKWADGLPQLTDPAYVSYQKNRLAEFENIRTSTLNLLADYDTLQSRLDHLDLLPNEPAQGDKSWRDLYTQWASASSPLLADTVITTALKPITDRVTPLLNVEKSNAYPAVVAAAQAPAPELALTAWRKLGAIPITETNPVLDDETTAQAHLKTLLDADKNLAPARTTAITAELARALPTRWKNWSDTLASPDPIQHAIDKAKDFNVTITPQSDARMEFNRLFYNLRKASDAKPAEADLKKTAQTFINNVTALPIANDPVIQDILVSIKKPLDPKVEQDASAAGAGPKLAGWDQEKVRDGVNIYRFTNPSTKEVTALEFVRVTAGDKQVYIASTELSLGAFSQVLNSDPKQAALLDNTKYDSKKQHWFDESASGWIDKGPRVWRFDGSQMKPNITWLSNITQLPNQAYYDPKLPPPAPPSVNSPMQTVTPYTAIYFAHLLGCRLPTSAEWLAAKQRFEDTATTQTKDTWNVRGDGAPSVNNWLAQQNYVKSLPAQYSMTFPDTNVFAADTAYSNIDGAGATPWSNADLAKVSPSRISTTTGIYNRNTLWFRDVGHEPGFSPTLGAGVIHDLIGNVAEYVFDPDHAQDVIKNNTITPDAVDAAIAAAPDKICVIGGSSLSPPQIPIDKPARVLLNENQAYTGFSDVGFRLAYTAPIQTINEVLAEKFAKPTYLPGPKVAAR